MKFVTDVDDDIMNQFLEGAKDINHWGRHIGKFQYGRHSIFHFAISLQREAMESQVKQLCMSFCPQGLLIRAQISYSICTFDNIKFVNELFLTKIYILIQTLILKTFSD